MHQSPLSRAGEQGRIELHRGDAAGVDLHLRSSLVIETRSGVICLRLPRTTSPPPTLAVDPLLPGSRLGRFEQRASVSSRRTASVGGRSSRPAAAAVSPTRQAAESAVNGAQHVGRHDVSVVQHEQGRLGRGDARAKLAARRSQATNSARECPPGDVEFELKALSAMPASRACGGAPGGDDARLGSSAPSAVSGPTIDNSPRGAFCEAAEAGSCAVAENSPRSADGPVSTSPISSGRKRAWTNDAAAFSTASRSSAT